MRCSRHSLACGPDGLCVLCRKDVPKAANGRRFVLASVLASTGALVLAVGGALAYRVTARRATPDIVAEARPAAPTPEVRLPMRPAPAVEGRSDDVSATARAREQAFREFQEQLAAAKASGEPAAPSAPRDPSPPPDPRPPPDPPPAPESVAAPPAPPPSIEDVRVVVYTASWCSVCKRAKAWMSAHGIAYEEHDIEASNDNARMNRALNPRGSIPTFDVEGDVLVGFSESSLLATMQRAAQRRAARGL